MSSILSIAAIFCTRTSSMYKIKSNTMPAIFTAMTKTIGSLHIWNVLLRFVTLNTVTVYSLNTSTYRVYQLKIIDSIISDAQFTNLSRTFCNRLQSSVQSIHLTHIHDCSLSCLSTDTSMKTNDGVKLRSCALTFTLRKRTMSVQRHDNDRSCISVRSIDVCTKTGQWSVMYMC
jgi:hypothetical protein